MIVNVWMALRDDAHAAIMERLTTLDEDYQGPVPDRAARIFRTLGRQADTNRIFRSPRIGGRFYTAYSVYLEGSARAQQELDWLAATYPSMIIVLGAWWFEDGRQVGTQWVDPSDHGQGVTGTALYPIHARLIDLLPDEVERDQDGNIISATRPAGLGYQVHLLQGQADRRFS